MRKVYLFSGNAWPFYTSRWGRFEKEFLKYEKSKNISLNYIENSNNQKKKRYKVVKAKISKRKNADYLKNIQFDYFNRYFSGKEIQDMLTRLNSYIQDEDVMKEIKEKAINNDSKSQLTLARCWLLGYKGSPNVGLAIYWSKLAAQKNDKAKRFLGFIYLFYIKNYKKAYDLFFELAQKGEVVPQFITELLQALFSENVHINKFVQSKLQICRNHGEEDDFETASAYYMLGLCYYCGFLGKKNYKKAFKYLEKAASLELVNSYFILGNMYEHGFGCKMMVNEAIRYYDLAANNHDQWAIYHLGRLYYQGKLVQKDLNKAQMYFQLGYEAEFLPAKKIYKK